MNPQKGAIQTAPFVRRVIVPAGIVFLVMVISLILYWLSRHIDDRFLHNLVSHVFAVLLFLSIGFGSILVYPLAFFRGAGAGERIFASLFTPVAWTIKEIVRVNDYFTFWESLYYGLNSLTLLTIFGTFGLMGICEIICRAVVRKQSRHLIEIITPVPVAAIFVSIIALYVLFIWGMGVHWFYIYMEGYKALFM